MGGPVSSSHDALGAETEGRVPCPQCGALILPGARKCRACRSWLGDPPRSRTRPKGQRAFTLIAATVVAVVAVMVSQRSSPVGEAPPLTPIVGGSAVVSAQVEAATEAPGIAAEGLVATAARWGGEAERPINDGSDTAPRSWRARSLPIDRRPLDLTFSPSGESIYVSSDDATLWEYDVTSGKVLHMTTLPAQGDRIRLLGGRYLAIIRRIDAGHIPLLDTQHWERNPTLLYAGSNPADIVDLPDGKTAVSASSKGKRLTWFDLGSGRPLADIQLPHATEHLYLLRSAGRPYVGAMGLLFRAGDPAGAWMDIFDPNETPFGATRRSIAVGRDPRPGAVTRDGSALLFADRVSNQATLVRIEETTTTQSAPVGQSPEAAFILGDDRYGVTINSEGRTATVLDLVQMKRESTLMFSGSPSTGATSIDGSTLFVSLGGTSWPPTGSGAAVVAGDPPHVVATFETDRGAARVAVAQGRMRAAVASYWGRSLTIIER
jgi:DNA-binding beta-propeller fold protein YncE